MFTLRFLPNQGLLTQLHVTFVHTSLQNGRNEVFPRYQQSSSDKPFLDAWHVMQEYFKTWSHTCIRRVFANTRCFIYLMLSVQALTPQSWTNYSAPILWKSGFIYINNHNNPFHSIMKVETRCWQDSFPRLLSGSKIVFTLHQSYQTLGSNGPKSGKKNKT